jgi:Zn/Cd-binding protein ZinT
MTDHRQTTTTMEMETTTTQNAVRMTSRKTSKGRTANLTKVTQEGVAVEVEMIQIHHQTMTMMRTATSRLTGTDFGHVAYNQVTPNRPAQKKIDRN